MDTVPARPRRRPTAAEEAWADSFLGGLPDRAQQELVDTSMPLTVPAGNTIYRHDDHPRLVLIVSGLARVVASSAEGRKATIRYARRADCVGAMSVVTKSQRVTVEAVVDTETLFLNVDRIRRLARTEPEVGWQLAQFVGKIGTDVIDVMSTAVFGSVRQRLARHLLDLAVRRGDDLVVTQDQQDIADAIGSVREVVARTLRDFREIGLVTRADKALLLVDPAALHALAVDD